MKGNGLSISRVSEVAGAGGASRCTGEGTAALPGGRPVCPTSGGEVGRGWGLPWLCWTPEVHPSPPGPCVCVCAPSEPPCTSARVVHHRRTPAPGMCQGCCYPGAVSRGTIRTVFCRGQPLATSPRSTLTPQSGAGRLHWAVYCKAQWALP